MNVISTPTTVEYIWIDGNEPTQTLRSKTRVIHEDVVNPEDLLQKRWSFDGSSTNQAEGGSSDCELVPVRVFRDPTRKTENLTTLSDGGVVLTYEKPNYIVMCEVFNADGTPHSSNHRAKLREILGRALLSVPAEGTEEAEMWGSWFGFEQEYTLFEGSRPLGFPGDSRFPAAQGPYYCGVGSDEVSGRELVEEHLRACLEAGIKVSGINAEVMPGQWEFQVGPCRPLEGGDHLWVARWLLYRLGEKYGINATLDPKPVPGDWNGAGMHTNFSTPAMRKSALEGHHSGKHGPFGNEAIYQWCEDAGNRVTEHLAVYGDGIESRLTGKHETCRWDEYKWGVSDRTASIRIPLATYQEGKGYLEDRRPNANACPYQVATVMLKTAFNKW